MYVGTQIDVAEVTSLLHCFRAELAPRSPAYCVFNHENSFLLLQSMNTFSHVVVLWRVWWMELVSDDDIVE